MDENKNIDQLRGKGWEEMSVLLDTHMPQETKRRPILWYWLAGAAAVLIGVVLPWALLMDEPNDTGPKIASQEQQLSKIEKGSTSIPDDSDLQTSSTLSDSPIVIGKTKANDVLDIQSHSFTTQDAEVRNLRAGSTTNSIENESGISGQNGISVQKPLPIPMESIEPAVDKGSSSNNLAIMMLSHTMSPVEYPDKNFEQIQYDRTTTVEIIQSSGIIKPLAFAETMWSLSDRFGFVNVGSGVQYALGKWTLGLHGGLTLPIPRQKSFYSSNQPFSNSFNFSSADAERIDNAAPGFAGSGSVVYYEKYTMKPGYVLGFTARVHIFNRWDAGVDLGRIGFRYDFTQKAEPNQNIAANTELTNAKNSLWYGGMSIHYHLGDQWIIQGGARVINLLNAGDPGVLPVVRLEYGF